MASCEYLYRRHFGSFVDFSFRELHPGECLKGNWHIELLADLLEFMSTTDEPAAIRRQILNLPPGYLKTHICAIALPAWLLGRDPRQSVLIISETPAHALEIRERCAELMSTKRYRAIFPRTRILRSSRQLELRGGGEIRHAGAGFALPVRRSDLVVIDNPQSLHSLERFNANGYLEIGRTLRDPKRGVVLLVTRRLGPEDLTAFLMRQGGWFALPFPVVSLRDAPLEFPPDFQHMWRKGELLHPELENWEAVETRLQEMGGEAFRWQYMQGLYVPQTTGERLIRVDENGTQWKAIGSFDPTQVSLQDLGNLRAEYEQSLSV
jgi:hypothetical protein